MTPIANRDPPHLYVASREGLLGIRCDQGEAQVLPWGLYGHNLCSLHADEKGVLLAVSGRDGELWSTNDGGETYALGQSPGGVTRLLTGEGRVLYAGLSPAGVAKSSDGGRGFSALLGFQGPWSEEWKAQGDDKTARVTAIVVRGSRVVAGVLSGGILVSETGGEAFRRASNGLPDGVLALAAMSGDEEFLAGTLEGLYHIAKLGTSAWGERFVPLERRAVSAVAVDPRDPKRMVCGASRALHFAKPGNPSGADAAIFWSHDGGDSFAPSAISRLRVLRGIVTSIVWLGKDHDRMFVGTSAGEIFESRDAGQTFTLLAASLPGVLAMVAGPPFR